MKVAIAGFKNVGIQELEKHMPSGVTEIVWSGNNDMLIEYANQKRIKLTMVLPKYDLYKNSAALMRNIEIIEMVDMVLVFGDNSDIGIKYVIEECHRAGKRIKHIKKFTALP